AHRHARMADVGLLHRVHRQGADGVGHGRETGGIEAHAARLRTAWKRGHESPPSRMRRSLRNARLRVKRCGSSGVGARGRGLFTAPASKVLPAKVLSPKPSIMSGNRIAWALARIEAAAERIEAAAD